MDTSNKILRLPEVIKKTGVGRSSIYKWMKEGCFPKQVKLGTRACGWIEQDLDAWIRCRSEER